RASCASTPRNPTVRRARWSTLRTPSHSAGGRRLPCSKGSKRPTAGSWTMSAPSAPSPRGDLSPEGTLSPDDELATEHLTQDLGRRSRRGGVVLLGAQMVRVLGQMGTLVVLARLLPPSAFGLLAMVAAIGLVLDLVKEFGLSSATIQKTGITHAQVSTLFWINAGVGAALGLLLFLTAPLISGFYGEPELEGIARWLAVGFVASGLTVQHWALLRRQMR